MNLYTACLLAGGIFGLVAMSATLNDTWRERFFSRRKRALMGRREPAPPPKPSLRLR